MRELSVGKQELCEERRGIEGILDLMSGRWELYGSPSPPLVRKCERAFEVCYYAVVLVLHAMFSKLGLLKVWASPADPYPYISAFFI
jgi:hypothetical protein